MIVIKNESTKSQNKSIKINDNLVSNIYLDITYPINYIFQYLTDNNFINLRKIKAFVGINILGMIILNSLVLFALAFLRHPLLAYNYKCVDLFTNSLSICTIKNFCYNCKSDYFTKERQDKCNFSCFDNIEQCVQLFKNETDKPRTLTTINTMNSKYNNLYFETNNKVITFFHGSNELCVIYSFLIVQFSFIIIGLILGDITLGILADKYGKRMVIIISSTILLTLLIGLTLASFLLITPAYVDNLLQNSHYTITPIQVLLGFTVIPINNLLIIHSLEIYHNISNLRILHGVINVNFALASLVMKFSIDYFTHYKYIFVFLTTSFTVFFILFVVLVPESARFYSERNDYENVKVFFEIIKSNSNLLKENEFGDDFVVSEITFFNSLIEVIENDEVKSKFDDKSQINMEARKAVLNLDLNNKGDGVGGVKDLWYSNKNISNILNNHKNDIFSQILHNNALENGEKIEKDGEVRKIDKLDRIENVFFNEEVKEEAKVDTEETI